MTDQNNLQTPLSTIEDLTGEFVRGWRVLFASFLGIGVSMVSLLYYSTGLFIKPLETEFGWSRAEIGVGSFISVIVIVLTAPLWGKLIDRLGLRTVTTVTLLIYSSGIYALSQMNGSLTVYYAILIYTTLFGVGCSPVAFTRAVTAWFDRNRGLALGIALTSTGIAGVLLPRYLTPFIADHGWRSGYLLLVALVIIGTPMVWLWIRDHPPELETSDNSGDIKLTGTEFALARRDRNFWIMGAMFFFIALAVGGLIISFIPLLLDVGLSPEVAGGYGALIGASVMGGRLVTGFIIDRIFAPYVTAVIMSLVAAGCLTLAFGDISLAYITAISLGFAMGAEVDLIGYFTAKYFGLINYGTIYGLQYGMFVLGAGISPIIAGHVYDTTGNYDLALIGGAGSLLCAVILSLRLGPFPKFTTKVNQ